jgi:DNA-binding NarL/FixJ family response regulator
MTPQLFEAYQAEIRGVEAQIENERQVREARKAFPRRRKRLPIVDAGRVAVLRAQGQSWREIGRQLGVSHETARVAL